MSHTDPIIDKIIVARVGLLLRHPFFGNMATRLKIEEASDWLPTAATDGRTIYFNREFFSRSHLKTSSKIYGDDQSAIMVEEIENADKALEYIRDFKNTRKHLLDLQKAKIVLITRDNLKILFETRKLDEYEDFVLEKY